MSICPPNETVARLMNGDLPMEELAEIRRHALSCADCLDLLNLCLLPELPPERSVSVVPFAATEAGVPERRPRLSWAPPAEFAEFEQVELIGKGGMGAVFRARDVSLGRLVALKFLLTSNPDDAALLRFRREAHAIAALDHPNVVRIYRVGELEGRPYLVAEWIEGKRLDQLDRPMPGEEAQRIGLGVARGLAAAHRRRILHRDIKPHNIMVQDRGEVKLLDFGLARSLSLRDADGRLTEAGWRVGTPRYMAPEVLRGEEAIYQSDVYSLGLVLYELCAGGLPAGAQDEATALPPLAQWAPAVAVAFAQILDRCVRRAPAERYETGEALCEALLRLAPVEVAPLLPDGNPYRGLRPFEREDRALFFGRGSDTRAVLERLRSDQMVLVAGDSGIGKSSLCRAGVIPAVLEVGLGSVGYCALRLFPGRRPLQSLAVAVAPLLRMREEAVYPWLRDSVHALGRVLREQRDTAVLIFVDQLEELVTLSDPTEAALFAQTIGELTHPSPAVRVLLSVRADFLTRVAALDGLGAHVQRALYLLRPLSREGIREAIAGPARLRGISFDDEALVLADSVALGPGGLPLLQFALAELWEARDRGTGRISKSALDHIGGVAGALSRHADAVIQGLLPGQQQAARRILMHLVTPEGTRAHLGEAELGVRSVEERAALQALVGGRLLCASQAEGGPVYELSHEVLIHSWSTLRGWLEADVGQRAALQRVRAAAAEWERLGQSSEALWSQRQLKELDGLSPTDLPSREQAFMHASRRRMRLRRIVVPLLLVLFVAVPLVVVRASRWFGDRAFLRSSLETALRELGAGREQSHRAEVLRPQVYALYDRAVPSEIAPAARDHAEAEWAKVLALEVDAEAALGRASAALEQALFRDARNQGIRDALGDVFAERVRLDVRAHRFQGEHLQRLMLFDPTRARRLTEPVPVGLRSTPAGASVRALRYQDSGGYKVLGPPRELGVTPLRTMLEPGSYLLMLVLPGSAEVRLPVLCEPGEKQDLDVPIPVQVPPGYAYVPPGVFLYGSTDAESIRTFLQAPPLHRVRTEGYLIGQDEVTFGDWIRYLDASPPGERERRQPGSRSGIGDASIRLVPGAVGGWVYHFNYAGHKYQVPAGQPLRYVDRERRALQDWLRFPVSGVSREDVDGYLSWLDRGGRLPGARLCTETEWERAARGADGRPYPMGSRVSFDDGNVDETYARKSFGPDEVGAHPRSTSPFGLRDMLGNACELTSAASLVGGTILRGGSWYHQVIMGHAANRWDAERGTTEVFIGFRVCATFPRP